MALHRPSIQNESVLAAMDQYDVQDIKWTDRADTFDQAGFAVPVQSLQREPAGINFAAFGHEFVDLVGVVLMARKSLVAQARKAALNAQRYARPIQQDRGFKALALQAGSCLVPHLTG